MPYQNFGQDLQQFMEAVRVVESRGSGGYQAVGVETKHGRGLGAYQIMSDYWDDWAEAAGIPGADWRDPAAQDRVAKYKMANLYYKYGSWDAVAAAWIGGEGGAQDFLAGGEGEEDALDTSVKEYVEEVNELFGPAEVDANVAGAGPQQGGLVAGAGGASGGYGGMEVSAAAPGQQSTITNETQMADTPQTTQTTQRQQDEKLVTATLEHLSNKIAGGQRKSVEEVTVFPSGAKKEDQGGVVEGQGEEVEAAGSDIQAAPTPPAEPTEGGLNPSFETSLEQMMSDAPGSVSITSGYRSVSRQKKLWNDALVKYGDPEVADNWVARPGSSYHNHGLAADLDYDSNETKQWVHDNAAKYGLHFPLSNEPWHAEPIGAR